MKPEEFAATYALTQENCQGPAVENKRKAEQAQCRELSDYHYQNNIISDREAGRRSTEGENWGYHQDNYKRGHGRNLDQSNRKHSSSSQEGEGSQNDWGRGNVIYRTKVVEEDDQICFTTRPVKTCRPDSRPLETKPRKYELHCMPKDEESLATKRRVEQGANPDLTQKHATKSRTFQTAVTCSAA